jgi:hypothetical protein
LSDTTLPSLVMTSTLVPPADASDLVVRDASMRVQQYCSAIDLYAPLVGSSFSELIYADNSGSDLGTIAKRLKSHRIRHELVRCPATPGSVGRGEGEARIIDHALQASALLEGKAGFIWKVTGRYRITNLVACTVLARQAEVVMNVRTIPRPWADTFVYGFTRSGHSNFLSESARTDHAELREPDESMEHFWAKLMLLYERNLEPVDLRLPREPYVTGTRGSDGRSYQDPRQRAKWVMRSVSKRLVPGLRL